MARRPAATPPPSPPAPELWAPSRRRLIALVVLCVVVVASGLLLRPAAVTPRSGKPEQTPSIEIPVAYRSAVNSWPRFFACYNLAKFPDVLAATLSEAGYPKDKVFHADRPIRVLLDAKPDSSRDRPAGDPAMAVQREALNVQAAREGTAKDPCTTTADHG